MKQEPWLWQAKRLLLAMLIFTFFNILSAIGSEPILSINTDMHTARISRVSTDAAGIMVLTVSDDKSAKLRESNSGALLKTFRIPIAEGEEGMLYSGTLSPDGKIVALGGWTKAGGNSQNIYIFDVASASLLQRISGLPNVINDLVFSPEGRYLAVGLGGAKSVKVYSSSDGFRTPKGLSPVINLDGYNGNVYKLAWDKDGRLASVCYDGKLRIYDKNLNLMRENANLAGKQPFSLAFSPDGYSIAVGFSDSPRIQVFEASTLKLLYEPDVSPANDVDKNLFSVSFTKDGRQLLAGGHYSKVIDGKWWRMIRMWDRGGRGEFQDYPAGMNSIMDIKAMPGNKILYSGGYPDWGIMDSSGKRIIYQTAETYDYRARDTSHLKLSKNAAIIGIKPIGVDPLSFDVSRRSLSKSLYSEGKQYSDKRSGISVTDWNSSISPKLNGNTLSFLQTHESSRCVDISIDMQRIIFGASWNLYCLDSAGKQLWSSATQAAAMCVNISDNGKAVVAGMGDGIIRWYRMEDGKLLLSLYLHPDGKRWLLWTASGYYDCSPGAEDLIGWHLNQGIDSAALYYPASRFRNKYYRPDLIDNILLTYDEDTALRLANSDANRKQSDTAILNILPPVVRIISPTHNQTFDKEQITIEYSAISPGGEPIISVRFMADGRPVETERGLIPAGNKGTIRKTLQLSPKDHKIQVLAENKHGWSTATEVAIRYEGKSQVPDLLKPSLYVLAIGVSDYKKPEYALNYAAKDARDLSAALQRQKGGLYKDVVIRTLTDKQATKDNILDALEWIQRQTTARDVAMIFLAGHGINDNNGIFYFMPHEADMESIRRTCLMFTELKMTVSTISGKVLLFVDACHSGNVWGSRRALPDVNALVNELSDAESGAVVFTSSTGKQYSLEDAKWGNGAFTKALIEGINGKADIFGKGSISVKALDAYIAERVKELTGGRQSPTAVFPQSIPDFPIGIKQ